MSIHSISRALNSYSRRICLMAYKIEPYKNIQKCATKPYSRYLQIEAKETSDNGAIIPCPSISIEALGFEYRRIEHSFVFSL